MSRTNTTGTKHLDNASGSQSIGSFGYTPTAGRCLVVYGCVVFISGTPGLSSITDDAGGTWTLATKIGASANHVAFIAWRENIPSGITSVSFNVAGNPGYYVSCAIDEFDDIVSSSALDQTNGGSGDMSAAAVSSGNITTTQANELLLTAAVSDDSSTTAWSAIGGSGTWTESFQEADTTAHAAGQAGFQYVNAIGTYNSTQRYPPSTNSPNDNVLIVSLNVASASGGQKKVGRRPRRARSGPVLISRAVEVYHDAYGAQGIWVPDTVNSGFWAVNGEEVAVQVDPTAFYAKVPLDSQHHYAAVQFGEPGPNEFNDGVGPWIRINPALFNSYATGYWWQTNANFGVDTGAGLSQGGNFPNPTNASIGSAAYIARGDWVALEVIGLGTGQILRQWKNGQIIAVTADSAASDVASCFAGIFGSAGAAPDTAFTKVELGNGSPDWSNIGERRSRPVFFSQVNGNKTVAVPVGAAAITGLAPIAKLDAPARRASVSQGGPNIDPLRW